MFKLNVSHLNFKKTPGASWVLILNAGNLTFIVSFNIATVFRSHLNSFRSTTSSHFRRDVLPPLERLPISTAI